MKRPLFPVSLLFIPVLPALHFVLCLAAFPHEGPSHGWHTLVVADFPVSLFAFGLAFRDDRPLLWFGLLGTLWWALLSFGAWMLWRRHRRLVGQAHT